VCKQYVVLKVLVRVVGYAVSFAGWERGKVYGRQWQLTLDVRDGKEAVMSQLLRLTPRTSHDILI
jgi:hypothetical protein